MITDLHGNGSLAGITLTDTVTGATREFAQGLFVAIDTTRASEIVRGQVEVDASGYVLVDAPSTRTNSMECSRAATSSTTPTARRSPLPGTGCAAALDAERYLPHCRTRPLTSLPLPLPSRRNEYAQCRRSHRCHLCREKQSSRPVLVDYWADWCAPCKQLSPIIDELARDYGDKVTFLKLDTNVNTATPVNYGVLSLPTIQIWVGGEVVKSFTGAKPKSVH